MIIIIILVSFRIKWLQIVGNIFIKLDLILMVVVKLERMNIISKLIFILFLTACKIFTVDSPLIHIERNI